MIRFGQRPQRTLARSVELDGVGFITGSKVHLRFRPAPVDAGITFLRTDLPAVAPIPACAGRVTGTHRRTTLGNGLNQVTLVEHVLAALAGMRVDNAVVELDAPEPPGLDGSAKGFVDAINDAEIVLQKGSRSRWSVRQPITVQQGNATLSLFPTTKDELKISYLLDYGTFAPIMPQNHTECITPAGFQMELAASRTFLLESEAHELQKQGIGKHLTMQEVVVFGARGPIANKLRYPDEPARHKVLDLVGDVALCGVDIVGHIVAYRSGHPLNVELAREIRRLYLEHSSIGTPCRRAA